MGLKLNPLTGQFDLTGSGGGQSYIDGEVAVYADLPLSSTTAPLNTAWLVRGSSGIWPFTKPGGVYVRTATAGSSRDADYTYAGIFPDVFSDANFTLYDDSDTSKNLKFQLSGLSANTTRMLTVPDSSGTVELTGHKSKHATGGTDALAPSDISASWAVETRTATLSGGGTYTLLQGRNVQLNVEIAGQSVTGTIILPRLTTDSAQEGDDLFITTGVFGTGATLLIRRYIWTGSSYISSLETAVRATSQGSWKFRLLSGLWTLQPVANHSHSTSDIISGVLDNARVNFAAPAAIGSTTPNTVAATDLSASNKLSLPSAAAASPAAGDLYRNANTLRYRDSTNTERLLLNATDNLANLASASTARTNLGLATVAATGAYSDLIGAPSSSGTKTYAFWSASSGNQPPSSGFATLDTRNSIAVLDFDDATTESAVFVGVMPEGASLGSGLIVRIHFMATTATSGNVRWSVSFERGNTDLDADSFDTATAATTATSSTSGIPAVSAITCTAIDGITAGDPYRLRIQRLGADAADTMSGDAEIYAVELRSAA